MITLDTSALFALLNWKDPDHGRVKALLLSDPGPYLVPMGILAEIAYLAERRLGLGALEAFLQDLEAGAFSLECGEEDLPRVRALVARYRDLPLGFADAAVVAVAERNGGLVLSLDRHLHVVAQEGTIRVLP
ncbi:type II toxin-antitoxin system VapC family toxin [Thermus igniterrae]|uniref:type II toxin-antitoxin system VapC family toxin n=1 Tax=Thermus igniterrae TaxID=88189 RepID=UPI00038093B2|nr:PIN domain-containing protein [Thermus igniterrae]